MRSRLRDGACAAAVAAWLVMIVPGPARPEDGSEATELRRELDAVKEQLRRVEQQMKRQEELLRKLSAERAPGEATKPPADVAREAEREKQDLKDEILEAVGEKLQPALSAANKTFPSQSNPAIGFFIDTAASHGRRDDANLEFRSGELWISANVDPFARAFAMVNGTPDGIEVEEAGIVTTSLPYNLTLKGGRFFADFGRLSKFHEHDLPFVNRPIALETYVGGESRGDGVEVSWLAPLESQYLTLTGGVYNKIGGENDRADDAEARELSKFTYLGRATTYFDLADAHGVDLGVSNAYTPKLALGAGKSRNLLDAELTYRYTPLGEAAYRGLVWGNEFLFNRETRKPDGTDALTGDDNVAPVEPVFGRTKAFGMYSYLEARLTRRFYPGFLFEYVQDLDRLAGATRGYSPYLTFWASDFQRFRLAYTRLDQPSRSDDRFFLQWTVLLGSHVHSFRDR